jgi:hypothetical protein
MAMTKDERKLRKDLKRLALAVRSHLSLLEQVMRQPESRKRGEAVARLCNALELENDVAIRFGLGLDQRTMKPLR